MSLPSLLKREVPVDIGMVKTLLDDWRRSIIRYLDDPSGKHNPKKRVHATNYVVYQNELYRKGKDGLLLICLGPEEVIQMNVEVHEGICVAHQFDHKLHWLLQRHRYFWPSILKDCIEYACSCVQCQIHGPIQRVPAELLHLITKPWPFRG